MDVRCEQIKYKKYKLDLKLAAVYVAEVFNNDVPICEREKLFKDFLTDLADLIKVEIAVPQGK